MATESPHLFSYSYLPTAPSMNPHSPTPLSNPPQPFPRTAMFSTQNGSVFYVSHWPEVFPAQQTIALSEFLPFGHLYSIACRHLSFYALISCPAFPHPHYMESTFKILIWDILHVQCNKYD